jgi:O-antigen ligase
LVIAATAVLIGITIAAALLTGARFGEFLLGGAVALTLGLWAVRTPITATLLLLVALFVRLPLKSLDIVPVDVSKIAVALLVVAFALWMSRTSDRLRGLGPVEWAMALYLAWNVFSMLSPHEYSAGPKILLGKANELSWSVPGFITFGVVIPFAFYMMGRLTFDRTAAVRAALWTVLGLAAYSAAMSILPFTGPASLVWPRSILEDPQWAGRAVGIFIQPVENGMVLTLGFAVALFLLSRREEPAVLRLLALLSAPACLYGIYLTHTRAIWLSALVVMIIGAILAKGFRAGFVVALGLIGTLAIVDWSVLSSSDREAGGVASAGEVQDRLNINKTALWAATQKPIDGWGIGRFYAVNTYHHQQWSADVPWVRGYGDSSHQNELGILAELGIVGLVLWLCVLVLICGGLWRAYRSLPKGMLCGQPLAVIAIIALSIHITTGLAGDQRFYDFPVAAILLLVGMAIGCSDRHRWRHEDEGRDITERSTQAHV